MEKNNNHPIQDLPLEEGQIIIYQPNETIKVEVKMEDETVWLTQIQMTELFQTSKQNVSLHINNIFKEGELEKEAVVKESLTTAKDGKKYKTKFYNLDVIISVGYRVKSIRGTRFRQWANSVLKDYLLHGYTFNKRIGLLEQRMLHAEEKIDFFVKTSLPPTEGIFFNGQIFDAYLFVTNLVKSAQTNIRGIFDRYHEGDTVGPDAHDVEIARRTTNILAVDALYLAHSLSWVHYKLFGCKHFRPRVEVPAPNAKKNSKCGKDSGNLFHC